jgi:hypothetical protein
MQNLNGRMYFLAALYHVRGHFSHLSRFMKQFSPRLNQLPYESAAVLQVVRQLREEYTYVPGKVGNEEALRLMLAEDLTEIEKVLLDDDILAAIDLRKDVWTALQTCKEHAVQYLVDIGVRIEPPGLTLLEKLPAPYGTQGYTAFVADEGDRQMYNIKQGVYFAANRLRPFYSEFILMHELLHVVLGKLNPDISAHGLEEGLAELVGAMYLSSKILGRHLTTNIFIYNRMSYGYQQFWELYMDATRQATLLYHRFGLRGIVDLVNSGRERLKQIEQYCLRMQFDRIVLPAGNPDNDLTDIADFLSLAYSRNMVVSPMAKYLTRYVRPGVKIAQILEEANVEREVGLNAIKELKQRVYLLSFLDHTEDIEKQRISRTDCERLVSGPFIRYEIQETSRT